MTNNSQNTPLPDNERLIKLSEVSNRTALSRSSIYVLIKAGTFPKQIKLGERASAWIESEVNQWIQDRIKEHRPQTA